MPKPVGIKATCPAILKAIGDEVRFKIVEELSKGPKRVKEINAKLKLPQSLLSHHLSILKKVGLVTSARDGKAVLYRIAAKSTGSGPGGSVDLGCCWLKFK